MRNTIDMIESDVPLSWHIWQIKTLQIEFKTVLDRASLNSKQLEPLCWQDSSIQIVLDSPHMWQDSIVNVLDDLEPEISLITKLILIQTWWLMNSSWGQGEMIDWDTLLSSDDNKGGTLKQMSWLSSWAQKWGINWQEVDGHEHEEWLELSLDLEFHPILLFGCSENSSCISGLLGRVRGQQIKRKRK